MCFEKCRVRYSCVFFVSLLWLKRTLVLRLVRAITLIAIATGTHFAALTLSEALLEPLSEALSKTLTLTLSIAGTTT